jgi:DNA recombination protein Rad52
MFTAEQKEALGKSLSKGNVKARQQGGRNISYIEGWKAIEEANRIFGFDGWTRETIDLRCVAEHPRSIGKDKKPGHGVSYIAKVRIVVLSGDDHITREGVGAGHGIDVDLGQAHESAIKEAETDAMKRAMMTFGNPFGLALYDKEQINVAEEPSSKDLYIAECKKKIAAFTEKSALAIWWNSDKEKKTRRDFELSADEVNDLKRLVLQRSAALESAKAA